MQPRSGSRHATACAALTAVAWVLFAAPSWAATAAPTLSAPVSGELSSSPLQVHYTLPQEPAPGTVLLTITHEATTVDVLLEATTSGEHAASLNTSDLSKSSGVSSVVPAKAALPDGPYSVTLSYMNKLGEPAASAPTAANVTIDTVTQPPTLSAPVSGAVFRAPFQVAYSLPEVAQSGSVKLIFAAAHGATSTIALATTTSAGAHTVTIVPSDLATAGTVTSGPSALAYDSYLLTAQYQDALGNPAAASTATSFAFSQLVVPIVIQLAGAGVGTSSSGGASTGETGSLATPTPPKPTRLSVAWRLTRPTRAHPRLLIATFGVVVGARSYTLALTRGRALRLGRCGFAGHSRRRRVSCSVATPRKGVWLARVAARGAAGRTLAVASRVSRF